MDISLKQNSATVTSLFQTDELAPFDFEENSQRKDRFGPEQRLLFAILRDAISCYQTYLLARKPEERALFADAEYWIFDDSSEFISFYNICDNLKLNANYVRRGLLAWKQRQLKRRFHSRLWGRWRALTRARRSAKERRGIRIASMMPAD